MVAENKDTGEVVGKNDAFVLHFSSAVGPAAGDMAFRVYLGRAFSSSGGPAVSNVWLLICLGSSRRGGGAAGGVRDRGRME